MTVDSDFNDLSERSLNRPKDTPFYQQRLRAWHPTLTAGKAYPIFLVFAVIFLPVGVVLLITSNSALEKNIEYTNCKSESDELCSDSVRLPEFYGNYNVCTCKITFELEENYKGQVYVFYGLTNYYQNHRRFMISRDDNQLNGKGGLPRAECTPHQYNENGKIIAPCGIVAYTLFNDTFTNLQYLGADGLSTPKNVQMTKNGTAWRTDVEYKFGKPSSDYWAETVKPSSWSKSALERSPDAFSGDEELIIWMRIAALPTFRKLYRLVIHESDFEDGLPAGFYSIDVGYSYPVTQFGGKKKLILSTMTWLGGRNPTLGIAYLVVGSTSAGLCIMFLTLHLYIRKRATNS